MDFQFLNPTYTQDGFHQDQGLQYIFVNQAAGNYFHGVAPTTGSGAISQPAIWPDYHGYHPQQHHGLFAIPTDLSQFLPVTEIPTFYPIPSQGNRGMIGQDGAVHFDPWLQCPEMHVGAMGQQHGTSVVLHPELQVPLAAMGGAGPQHGAYVHGPYAPHMQAPLIFMDAIGQQPVEPQLQVPFTWVDGEGLPHGTSVPFDQYRPAPLDATGLQPLTTVPFSPVPAPSLEPLQLIGNTQLPWTGLQAAGPSSTSLMSPAPMEELQDQLQQQTKTPTEPLVGQVSHTVPTGESLRPQVTTFTEVTEAKKAQIEPLVTRTSLASGNSLPENATNQRYRKRKHQQVMATKATKSSDGENEGPDTSNDSSQKTRSKRVRRSPISLPPRSKLREHMVHYVPVLHQLGVKVDKVRPPNPAHEEATQLSLSRPKTVYSLQPRRIPLVQELPRQCTVLNHAPVCSHTHQPCHPALTQSRPSAPLPKTQVQRPPAPVQQVRHFYKDHSHGSVSDYGDGEVVVYLRPGYRGMFPLPLVNPKPQPLGAPRRFHCREHSITIPAEGRAEREAMKREAKLKRDQEAQVTGSGMDCSVLADRKHLPYEPWPTEDNWWETGLDDVWKFDECLEHIREDVV